MQTQRTVSTMVACSAVAAAKPEPLNPAWATPACKPIASVTAAKPNLIECLNTRYPPIPLRLLLALQHSLLHENCQALPVMKHCQLSSAASYSCATIIAYPH